MKRIKAIIIDDEEIARLRLRKMLSKFDNISIVDEAENGIEAIEKIDSIQPDLIFLDIQMPGNSGFDVLKKIKHRPVAIFTTAYDEYALKAFDENAIAYLLKPIDAEKLSQAIKTSIKVVGNLSDDRYDQILDLLEKKELKQFLSKVGSRIKFIPCDEVAFIESKDKHSFIHTKAGTEFIIDQTLTELEKILPPFFLRVHRGSFINVETISEAERIGEGKFLFTIKDKKQSQIQSSASYLTSIKENLNL